MVKKFEIKQKGPGKSKSVGLRVEGNIFLPLFVDRDTFRAKREWNEDGTLKVQGEAVVPFLLNIPKSVANGEKKGRFVLYGHGLMGSRFEADTSWLNEFANEHGYIIIAVDWQGMSTPDAVTNLAALDGKLEDFHYMIDRLHQGFANFLALAKFVKGKFRQHEFFQKRLLFWNSS